MLDRWSMVFACLLTGLCCILAPAQEPTLDLKSSLVAVQEGELPIILSAPHGGKEPIPNVPERRGEGLTKGPSGFFTGRDVGTEELTQELAQAIAKRMGKKPYLVVARFHRKYIDANRPIDVALESASARPIYEHYHGTLAKYCLEVQKRFGRGLLLDLHGQGTARDTIFRGTNNGKTVQLLRDRFGEPAHVGPNSFFGLLKAQGWKIAPDGNGRETSGFTGGHIVQTYGSHTGYGIDAIQLEMGADFRSADQRSEVARKLAEVVQQFAQQYLSQ